MKAIAIGIYLHSEPDRLRDTLAHLSTAANQTAAILLLPDGPDAAMQQALADYSGLPQYGTSQPLGAASCFNRLLQNSDAEIAIFLEAGSLVGPGWLDRLLASLCADPSNGLAGPSTNRSWNRQAAFPHAREADISRTADLAGARFSDSWQSAEPLYCLADFCYAVRRDVVDAIGYADEAYGLGPCWEMDYTLRAARAGFRAVWAKGAYVYRRPFTLRREQDEARLFEPNKRRYQDKFCGLRLTGERKVYAQHCRGDACSHFAPLERIQQHLPMDNASASRGQPARQAVSALGTETPEPLVSCIMPTRDRFEWMLQAIVYFQRQGFDDSELIIINDGVDCSGDLPCDPRIRYIHSNKRLSIGAKRNRACELARGKVIVHWDDDDWYSAERLRTQVAPLLAGSADVTALNHPRFFDVDRWEFWTCTPAMNHRLFVHGVHGGTLAFRRNVFEHMARYPDSSLAEDAAFLSAAVARGARLQVIAAGDLFLYLRHGSNAWAFTCGSYLDARGWQQIVEPGILGADRAFYAARSWTGAGHGSQGQPPRGGQTASGSCAVGAHIPVSASAAGALPLVSCIMPTHNRRGFVPRAIEYFLRQDYPNRELVILDDGEDRVADLVPELPSLRYVALAKRLRLGAKRNAAIEASRGAIVIHWDDDDWMISTRVSTQVSALLAGDADICGVSKVWFCEISTGRLSTYHYPSVQPSWLYGASLCYRRSLWERKRFEALDVGEDTRFVWAHPRGRMLDLDDARFMVAMIHGGNTSSPRPLTGPNWHARSNENASEILGKDWAFYEGLP